MMVKEERRRYLAIERRELILDLLREHRSVEVSALSEELGVSEVTVRKDLEKLEIERLIVRSHGGAVLSAGLLIEPSFVEKDDQLAEEKAAIAAEAASLVGDDSIVALATGTTVGRLPAMLAGRGGLRVVTNAVNVATAFLPHGVDVFLTGGTIRPRTFGLIGEVAERSLDGVMCDFAFIGTNGISLESGLTTPNMDEARVVRAMMNSARRVVLLADHSKFPHTAFYRITPAERVHMIITDAGAPVEEVERLRAAGIEVRVV
ncbi:DeoR/GlpR family DNA-binding transcription regulator [Microbacterium sp. A93]|uniref:DeoR/GlpR family DNA-binding transcription regulator n=1 Tax=unclassified Microbacterium TaxID=2609290 RepID=UPI003F425AEB